MCSSNTFSSCAGSDCSGEGGWEGSSVGEGVEEYSTGPKVRSEAVEEEEDIRR
jgi:hypothetical protein